MLSEMQNVYTTVFTDPQATDRYKLISQENPKKTKLENSEGSAHTSGCHTHACRLCDLVKVD